jgi:hypothetical protein
MATSLIHSRKVEGKEDTKRYDSENDSFSDEEETAVVKFVSAGKR